MNIILSILAVSPALVAPIMALILTALLAIVAFSIVGAVKRLGTESTFYASEHTERLLAGVAG